MVSVLTVVATAGLAASFAALCYGWRHVRNTTLSGCWLWLATGLVSWSACWLSTVLLGLVGSHLEQQVWYLVSVLMLCPLIAVLGARRPASRIWSWFVVWPLLLVLGWPALAAWNTGETASPFQLEGPALMCYGLVLIMGVGNYCGTRHTVPALLLAIALVLLVAPATAIISEQLTQPEILPIWATICLAAAFGTAMRGSTQTSQSEIALDRLWIDYRDQFGIVWARRFQDRVNQTAEAENWPARLQLQGLVWSSENAAGDPEAVAKIETTYRWLLRRFVDPEWIDRRLKN